MTHQNNRLETCVKLVNSICCSLIVKSLSLIVAGHFQWLLTINILTCKYRQGILVSWPWRLNKWDKLWKHIALDCTQPCDRWNTALCAILNCPCVHNHHYSIRYSFIFASYVICKNLSNVIDNFCETHKTKSHTESHQSWWKEICTLPLDNFGKN